MGFDVFLRCLDDDQALGLSRDEVRALFPVIEKESERNRWNIRYDSKNFCEIYVQSYPSHEDRLGFLTIDRPCGDTRLWESVPAILRMGRVVLYFPGGPPMVADEAVGAALPSDEVESMGPPRCVQSAQEIVSIIQSF